MEQLDRLYMIYMILNARVRGYDPLKVAAEANHNEWLAFCYEIHDQTIIRWRKYVVRDPQHVPHWTTYRFRNFCHEVREAEAAIK